MSGGMNNANNLNHMMYNFAFTPYTDFSNVKFNNTTNENSIGSIPPPWDPRPVRFFGVDADKKITLLDTNHNFSGYVFRVSETYETGKNNKGEEFGYMYIHVGSSHEPNCVAAVLSSKTDYKFAELLGLYYDECCTEFGKLPEGGEGSRMLMEVMKKCLNDNGITHGYVTDNAYGYCKDGSNSVYETSVMYYLSRGEPYYHAYGFYPEKLLDSYVNAVISMKKITWDSIRTSKLDSDIINDLERIATSYNGKLKYEDKAMDWFSAVWTKDCSYLLDVIDEVLICLKQLFGITKGSITDLWKRYGLQTNPDIITNLHEILKKYSKEDRMLFTKHYAKRVISE
jgi:hypothetical protein